MLTRRFVHVCAIIVLTGPLWSQSADQTTVCPKEKLTKIIKGSEVGSIDYTDSYDNAMALKELKISPVGSEQRFAVMQSTKSFGEKFPEKTKELINRFINSGEPHFAIIYDCPTAQIVDVKMYADYWGAETMPVSEGQELRVAGLYAIGKKYRGQKLPKAAIKAIANEYRKTLQNIFQTKNIRAKAS
ncbi:hypothetical protein [Turneriella parva]|uniref:Uncharacterized protein n=1 Tax=Turneriella parva (strain ATCC BAA-1111 / DSM 21527 / NCTC 11395 / H) TaxID=869212 RepID=I4B5G8_TURPD|nr:hypothetical protein [Turneriella parva]AFM12525.1 hypothetical protein Turpa_1878 [Turneriella parva DSM 21527]